MRIAFEIPGEPKGKQRPRWNKVGTYTPAQTKSYEAYVKQLFCMECPQFVPMEGALRMEVRIFTAPPKSASNKKREAMLNGIIRPTKRPDVDNILKIIMDALEGLAYSNDKQIVQVQAFKLYNMRPRTEVVISESC